MDNEAINKRLTDFFCVDERIYLNHLLADGKGKMTKDMLLRRLAIAKTVNAQNEGHAEAKQDPYEARMLQYAYRYGDEAARLSIDLQDSQEMAQDMINRLYSKIKTLTHEEYEQILNLSPLSLM